MRARKNYTGKGIRIDSGNYKYTFLETRMNGKAGTQYSNTAGGNAGVWWTPKGHYLCITRYILKFK